MIPLWLTLKIKAFALCLWDYRRQILTGLVLIFAIIGLITLFRGCNRSKPVSIDETDLQRDLDEMRQREQRRLDESLRRANAELANSDARIREAEANTNRAANVNRANKNNRELERELKEKLNR